MKIQIDNTARNMTPEEEQEWMEWSKNVPSPTDDEALTRYANELTGDNAENIQEATENLIKIVKED